MKYVFDLDGVLCSNEEDVYKAEPYFNRITKVNRLYEQGHKIMIDSARGTITGKDHQEKTEEQLKEWGVKYHYLRTGVKFYGDYYVDDKAIKDYDFFKGI